jgi:hypothetical protein
LIGQNLLDPIVISPIPTLILLSWLEFHPYCELYMWSQVSSILAKFLW